MEFVYGISDVRQGILMFGEGSFLKFIIMKNENEKLLVEIISLISQNKNRKCPNI